MEPVAQRAACSKAVEVVAVKIIAEPGSRYTNCMSYALWRIAVTTLLLFATLLVTSSRAPCQVDGDSAFVDARYAASALDLRLYAIEQSWNQQIAMVPQSEAEHAQSLLIRAGLAMNLIHLGNDMIAAHGTILNHDGFLKLSASERKALLRDTLDVIVARLGAQVRLAESPSSQAAKAAFIRRHVNLTVAFSQIRENARGESIVLAIPQDIGDGQAGYANGTFVFSDPYYVHLQAAGEYAVVGDPTKFEIERE